MTKVKSSSRTNLSRQTAKVKRLLVITAERRETITYRGLANAMGMDSVPNMALAKVLGPHLLAINEWCSMRNVPLLAALVVNKSAGIPSGGFWNLIEDWGYYSPIVDDQEERRQWAEAYNERIFEWWGTSIVPLTI